MSSKEIHFFDLDGTLWNMGGKVWVINKNRPNIPMFKLDSIEFALIKNGKYKQDNLEVNYNDEKYFISEELFDRINKKQKVDIESVGFSFREFFDTNYIDNLSIIIKNIIDLNNKKVDVGILSARHNQDEQKDFLNALRVKLNELNLDLNKIYYLGERFQYGYSSVISHQKTKVLLEHLVGIKIEKDRFNPIKQDWYQTVHFYDDEPQNIYSANDIQSMLNNYLSNSEDEVFKIIMERVKNYNLTLNTHLVTNNLLNKFKTTSVILSEPTKYPIQVESTNSILKFKDFKN